jgi:hypothetical protein
MPRQLLSVLAVLALLSGCMTREGRRDLTWEQGGYTDPEGAAPMNDHGPQNRRVEQPGS